MKNYTVYERPKNLTQIFRNAAFNHDIWYKQIRDARGPT